ncbi:MAG: tetratricopeptide repeat protein [Rhodospirillales bacterium]|nr:tetratricopeptide repeat protein [Rhodospirillales bacterium]
MNSGSNKDSGIKNPSDSEIQQLLNTAIQHHSSAQLSKAEAIYQQILVSQPDNPIALHLLGVTAHQNGNSAQAIDLITKALKINPRYAEAHSNLGLAHLSLGKPKEAAACFRKALSISPDTAESHSNLGNALLDMQEATRAIASYRKALAINPNFLEAHFNLGNAFKELGKLTDAATSYQRALAINPQLADVHNNLAIVFGELGNFHNALACQRRAVALSPKNEQFWTSLLITLEELSFTEIDERLVSDLLQLFERRSVRPSRLAILVIRALRLLPSFSNILKHTKESRRKGVISNEGMAEQLSEIPLFLKVISLSPVGNLEIERMLTFMRHAMLKEVLQGDAAEECTPFLTALALQCFTNEFVFYETADETADIVILEQQVTKLINEKKKVPKNLLVILSAYRPLFNFPWAKEVRNADWPESVQEVIKRHIIEPAQEQSLRSKIASLTSIQDTVSQEVQAQYEENPYPRWVKTNVRDTGERIDTILKGDPMRFDLGKYRPPANPEILVAGCGTGQHPIGTASRFSNSKVLALDLSLSSLSYAKRKTHELGISNIEYYQADIMELGKLDRQFDVVESAGVLHHLGDPLVGWRILTDLLKPGGVMMIALYSETARQDVVHGRSLIADKNYPSTPEGIRQYRHDIAVMAEDGDQKMAELCTAKDFFSLSECRDLLFHVQEHRFTLLQIKEALKILKLEFLGFEFQSPKALNKFRKIHRNRKALTSLSMWHKFELENPDTFRGMYQFWCKKT